MPFMKMERVKRGADLDLGDGNPQFYSAKLSCRYLLDGIIH